MNLPSKSGGLLSANAIKDCFSALFDTVLALRSLFYNLSSEKYGAPNRHAFGCIRPLELNNLRVCAAQPQNHVSRFEDCHHRLGMDGLDQWIGVAGDHREARPVLGHLPKARDREHRLIDQAEPHLSLERRLAIAEIVLVWGELGELRQGHAA